MKKEKREGKNLGNQKIILLLACVKINENPLSYYLLMAQRAGLAIF